MLRIILLFWLRLLVIMGLHVLRVELLVRMLTGAQHASPRVTVACGGHPLQPGLDRGVIFRPAFQNFCSAACFSALNTKSMFCVR